MKVDTANLNTAQLEELTSDEVAVVAGGCKSPLDCLEKVRKALEDWLLD